MKRLKFILLSLYFLSLGAYSQQEYKDAQLVDMYENYTELPREVAFVHLNKSVYIKGELLAFQAYVLDKNTKELSEETTNLYVSISDAQGQELKKKLFRVSQGHSNGSIEIDSLFTSGQYVIKAYTNWMRNFKEQNFFIQNFKVIDPDNIASVQLADKGEEIEAQFLPEGGHLVANIKNTIGVTLKNDKGFGIAGVKGKVLDQNNTPITTFKTNELGFSKFYLQPQPNNSYFAEVVLEEGTKKIPLETAERQGIIVELQDLKTKVALAFRTNPNTPIDRKKGYQLAIHNGANLKITEVAFEKDQLEVLKVIPYEDLDPGLNIFTLLDRYNEPILERLFFKYEKSVALKSQNHSLEKVGDSLLVRLKYKHVDPGSTNAISISILPKNTLSYAAHHNLFSYTSLQPYLRGYVENARYYFENYSPKKSYDLDLLLMTQGWSSYNWKTIFNDPPDYNYDFENGISFTAKLRGKSGGQLLRYPGQGRATEFINLSTEETSFVRSSLFPVEGEKIRIGEILPDGKVIKPKLVVLFEPSEVPPLNVGMQALIAKSELRYFMNASTGGELFGKVERLDEVIVTDKKAYTRIERLKNLSSGNIEVFDEDMRLRYRYFSNYISQRGYIVDEGYFEQIGSDTPGLLTTGLFRIVNRIQSTVSRGGAGNIPSDLFADHDDDHPSGTRDQITSGMIPSIYLNDILLSDLSVLYRFDMSQVDYIDVDRYGLGGGMRGGGGIIRIYTDPSRAHRENFNFEKTYEEYALPMTFSKPRKYYTPKYNSYTNNFFREYGVIAWVPELNFDAAGELSFKIPNTGIEVLELGIEGIANKNMAVSEILEISVN